MTVYTQVESLLKEGCPVLVGSLGDLGGLVVADVGVEGGDQHQRLVHQLADVLPVGLDADHAVVCEGHTAVSQQSDGSEHISHHHRLEHVKLKVAVGAAHRHRHVIAHDLGRYHGDGLALGGVNLQTEESYLIF